MFSSAVVKSAKVAQLLHFPLPWADKYLIGIGLSWDNVGLATFRPSWYVPHQKDGEYMIASGRASMHRGVLFPLVLGTGSTQGHGQGIICAIGIVTVITGSFLG